MKLYHFPASPNSRRVLAVAFHLGLDLELETVDLSRGEQMKPSYLKLNPNHKIPVLVDDDFVLWESSAIMLYLLGKKPDNDLFAGDSRTRADIHRWLFWNVGHWNPACGIYIYEYLVKQFLNQGEPDAAEIRRADELFHRFAKVLDDHLKHRAWLVDERLTVADYAVGSMLDLAAAARYPVGEYNEIKCWYGNIEKVDAWKKSAPANFM